MEERFFKVINKDGPIHPILQTKCWVWKNKPRNKDGYGRIRPGNKRTFITSNRASWIIHFGSIPDGFIVCHKCDNPSCVNPDHLFLGTHRTNAEDKHRKGRDNFKYGQDAYLAKLTNEEAKKIRELYKTGKYLQKDLAKLFGINQSNISAIILNKTYHS